MRSRRDRRTVASSLRTQMQGCAFPKRGWSTGSSRRTNPAPPQMGQPVPGSSAGAGGGAEASAEVAPFPVLERISFSSFIASTLLGPAFKDALDVLPVADVHLRGRAERIRDPLVGIELDRFE